MVVVVPGWSMDPRATLPDLNPTIRQLHGLWATYFTSLGLSFLIGKIGIKEIPAS